MWFRKPVYAFNLVRAVEAEIDRGVDVVHFVWVGFPVLFGILQRRFHKAGARSVTTLLNRYARPERYIRSDRLIAHSPAVRDRLMASGYAESRITLLPPPIDDTRYFPRDTNPEPYFVFASGPRTRAQVEERGVLLMYRAFAKLKANGETARLVFLNRWPAGEQYLKKLADGTGATNVDIVSGQGLDVAELIASSSGVIIPYCKEVIGDVPVSGIEALACGRPVIATRECGISDYLAGTRAGKVIDASVDALGDAVSALARDAAMRREAARTLYESMYAADFVSTMHGVYLGLRN